MKKEITIIVCTYNRAPMLKKAIQSLVNQSFTSSRYQIIIADDGSTDNSCEVVLSLKRKYRNHTIRFFQNKKNIGLAKSRNLMLNKTNTRYVGFLDDDAQASKKWLELALRLFQTVKPQPIIVAGPIIPIFNTAIRPIWYKDEYESDKKQGKKARFLKKGETFSGSNLIIQTDVLKKYGGFNETLGMKGEILSVGEETSVFDRLWHDKNNNTLFYYSPEMKVYHTIHPYKMTIRYRLKRYFASGQSFFLRNREENRWLKMVLFIKVVLYTIIQILLVPLTLIFYKRYQNWVVERIGPLFFVAGFFSDFFSIKIKVKNPNRI